MPGRETLNEVELAFETPELKNAKEVISVEFPELSVETYLIDEHGMKSDSLLTRRLFP